MCQKNIFLRTSRAHDSQYIFKNRTIKLTAVELHSDCGFAVPVNWMQPNEPTNYRGKEGVFLGIIRVLVPNEYLVTEMKTTHIKRKTVVKRVSCNLEQCLDQFLPS